jgi:uncharacterized delta-60 repeat protein
LTIEALEDRTLLNAGDLDPSFGVGGLVTTEFLNGPSRADTAAAVAVQADGKIVVAGTFQSFNDGRFALVRYNPDGSLDTGFGTLGRFRW